MTTPQAPQTIVVTAIVRDWQSAQQSGQYTRSTIDSNLVDVGFIHATFPSQTIAMLNRRYTDQTNLVLLLVDSTKLRSPLKVEAPLSGSPGEYPHIYGPLNIDAVYEVLVPQKSSAGLFMPPVDSDANWGA